jgi:hypothetical protein
MLRQIVRHTGNCAEVIGETDTTCPIIMQLQIPPLPRHVTLAQIEQYEAEVRDPTGIGMSIPRPPGYWEASPGLGGVIIADGCGWAFGVSGGTGVPIDDFWRKSLNCRSYQILLGLR